MWKLISYSDLKVPLKPYKSNYAIGIVENDSGQRKIAQINKKYSNQLSIGMYGEIEFANGINGKIDVFIPDLDDIKTEGNKVALITGSSRGIGRAIAIELAKNGFDIIINNNESEKEGIETANEINKISNAIFITCDITNPDQINKMIEKTIDEYGKIDVLVNNAGIAIDKRFENMTFDQWEKVISVNLTGAFNCTKAVINHMQKQGGGNIINISSIIGEIGNTGQANYAASKGGLIAFTKSLAKEYAMDEIYVNAIAPGFIKTKMTDIIPAGNMKEILEQLPLGRLGTPEEVAKVVRFLVAESSYITGQVINVNGGIYV